MKTFSDSQSLVQQEAREATLVKRVELLVQHAGAITAVDSATQIKVAGDATALLSEDDWIVIPLDAFPSSVQLSAAPSFSADETTLQASGASFSSGLVGKHVAKRFTVSGGNVERLIEQSPVRYEVEGEVLSSFRAADVEFNFENGDGFFSNSAGSGILDGEAVVWCRIYYGWKGAADRMLWFGGILDRDFTQDIRSKKQYRCSFFGHLTELERYPGWVLRDASRKLLTVRGVDVLAASAVDGMDVVDGVRKLKLTFPGRDFLSGLEISSVSLDTKPGFHLVKYRAPDLFQYDYGDWVAQTLGAEDVTITGAEGNTAKVNMPRDFDLLPRYLLFWVNNNGKATAVAERGTMQVQLGNGAVQEVLFDFQYILHYNGSDFSDISFKAQNKYFSSAVLLDSAADAVYFLAPEKWGGIEFTLNTNLVADLNIEYSQGFGAWGALTVTDTTSGLTQDGAITWDLPKDWVPVDLEAGGSVGTVRDVFIVRINLSSYTSGSCAAYFCRRYLRVVGDDGLTLDLKANLGEMRPEGFETDLVVLDDGAGGYEVSTWRAGLSLHGMVVDLLDEVDYGTGKRTLDDLKYSLAAPVIGNYGQGPVPGYQKKISAILVDTSTTPETVWLGIGDELWKVTEKSEFEFVDRLQGWDEHDLEIRRLVIDDNGYLQGVAWKAYNRILVGAATETKRRTPAVVFRSTNLTSITEENRIVAGGAPVLSSGDVCYRNTRTAVSDGVVGRSTVSPAGENVAAPFEQPIFGLIEDEVRCIKKATLVSTSGPATGVESLAVKPLGWYLVASDDTGDIIRFDLGSHGFCVWDEESDKWVIYYWDGANSNRVRFVDYTGAFTEHLTVNNNSRQFIAGCAGGAGNVYCAEMEWDNVGETFPGDLSDCKLVKMDMSTATDYTVIFAFASDSVEASQSLTGDHESSWPKVRSTSIIEMAYNPTEESLHLCLLDRYTLQYHWGVYDIVEDKLYSSQSGANFDFNEGMQIMGLCFNPDDDKVYACVADRRYDELELALLCADFDATRSAGDEIEITRLAGVLPGETFLRAGLAAGGGGRIYGASGNVQNALWQWDDTFYPRLNIAQLGGENIREVLTNAVQVLNRTLQSRADRTLRVVERENYDGSKSLYDHLHIIDAGHLKPWQHQYDRVEVSWADPATGQSGTASAGSDGWQRRVLKLENPLVQSRSLAQVMAQEYLAYFGQRRQAVEAELAPQLELEEMDRVRLVLGSGDSDIDRDTYFKLTKIEFDDDGMIMRIEGLD